MVSGEESTDKELAAMFADILALRGRIFNVHRALGKSPAALRAFMVMSRHIRNESPLPAILRELAVLTVAYRLENFYEVRQHKMIAQKMGIPDVKLAALETPQSRLEVFDATERAVIVYAAHLAKSEDPPDSVLDELKSALSPGEVVDLALTVGWYRLVDALIRGLKVPPEE